MSLAVIHDVTLRNAVFFKQRIVTDTRNLSPILKGWTRYKGIAIAFLKFRTNENY
jgi:hypothetical protein